MLKNNFFSLSFISLQAKNPIGFDKHVRLQVELNICQNIDNNNCEPNYLFNIYSDCFFLPLLIDFNILDKIYFNKFLSSKMYAKYTDELLATSLGNSENKIQNTNKITEKTETSAVNKPLMVKFSKKSYNIEFSTKANDVKDLNISSNQSENYQENVNLNSNRSSTSSNCSNSKIQIGHVDSFGRYIRQIDDEPVFVTDKKKPFNKLMNFLNKNNSGQKNIKFKFSSSDVNDDEEEEALKAAEMLIKDVVGDNKMY